MKISFNIKDRCSTEICSDGLKLMVSIEDEKITIEANQESLYESNDKPKESLPEKCWDIEEGGVIIEESPLSFDELHSKRNYFLNKLKEQEGSHEQNPSMSVIDMARRYMEKMTETPKKTHKQKVHEQDLKDSACLYNKCKNEQASYRRNKNILPFSHFLHKMIDTPLFDEYKDKEGSILILEEEGDLIYFCNKTTNEIFQFDTVNKKIRGVPEREIEKKFNKKLELLKEFDEVEEKMKEKRELMKHEYMTGIANAINKEPHNETLENKEKN